MKPKKFPPILNGYTLREQDSFEGLGIPSENRAAEKQGKKRSKKWKTEHKQRLKMGDPDKGTQNVLSAFMFSEGKSNPVG
ncbi:MAG: hypothetical protein U0X91_17960 [Spirosomataceae bacterium]